MAAAEEWFIAEGCGRLTMNMVLTGTDTYARPGVQDRPRRRRSSAGSCSRHSRSRGRGCTGSRSRAPSGAADTRARRTRPSGCSRRISEYYDGGADRDARRGDAATTCTSAVSKGFHDRGYHLGHVTGHSIGMTMIEFPKVGEGSDVELQENMVLSMHPHAIAGERRGLPLHAGHLARDTGRAACRSPTSRWRSGPRSSAQRQNGAHDGLTSRQPIPRGGTLSR